MQPRNMPRSPANRPRDIDLPEIEEMIVMPNTMTAKYSAGPNDSATLARAGAQKLSTTTEKRPPMNELIVAMPSASTARPFWAIG